MSALAPLAPASAQSASFIGAYAGPVYTAPFASAAVPAASFAFNTPPGYYVAAASHHGGDDDEGETGKGGVTLFLDHTGNASCLARFECNVTGGQGATFHFTGGELGDVTDPKALTAYIQHLDYVAPIPVLSPIQHVAVTPEPDSRGLLAAGFTGLAGLGVVRRRRG